jgi:arylsulfatase A-like enzyme
MIMLCRTRSLALLVSAALAAAEHAKPNVLVILADDLGYRDVGFQGATDVPTPHLDALAASGVRCTQGYVSAPVCSPSRAGLLTGRNGVRFGYEFNPGFPTKLAYGLPRSERTLASRLGEAGYHTGAIGKWHLGESAGSAPGDHGFAYWHGILSGAHRYLGFDPKASFHTADAPLVEGRELRKTSFEGHLTAHFTTKAVHFIKESQDKPWFLYLSYTAPHSPFEPSEADQKPVAGIADPVRRAYAGLIVGLDRGVGRVVKALEESGQRERTLIVFLSDNGGAHANSRLYPANKGLPPEQCKEFSDNAPLRGFKHSLWEGGVRVPFVVSWPGRIPAGVSDAPVWSLDIAATALAAAGAPQQADADGVDLLPYFSKATATPPRQELYIRYGIDGVPGRMLRTGPLKLVDNEGAVKLYDVVADPGETRDLARDRPQDLARLEARWKELEAGFQPALWAQKSKGVKAGKGGKGDVSDDKGDE